MFTVILFSFIYGYSFYKDIDCYRSLVLVNDISREKYIITKLFVLFFISVIFVFFSLIIHYLIPLFFKVYIDIKGIYFFISLIFLVNYYGLISVILVQITDNIYVCLLPIFIYILINSFILNADRKIINLFGYFFIIFDETNTIIHSNSYSILIILLLIIVNIVIFNKRDLHN